MGTIYAPTVMGVAPPTDAQAVRGNFAWTSAGNAIFSACQWGMVSVLAKLGSPEMVGIYALGLAITTPPLMLAQLNLRSVLATDVKQEHDFRDYRDLRGISVALTLVALAVYVVFGHTGAEAVAILLIGLVLGLQLMSDIYIGLLQAHERMDRVAISMASSGIVGLAALAVTVRVSGSLNAGLAAVLAGRLIVFLVYDSRLAVREYIQKAGETDCAATEHRKVKKARGADNRLHILRTALPLGAVMMIGSLSLNLPRYFIAHNLGERLLGIFSAIASLTAAANLLINALGQASTSRLAKLYSAGRVREFKLLTWRLIGVAVLLGVGGAAGAAVAGPQVLTILFRPEYAAHSDVLVTLAMAAAAAYVASLLGYAITACRCFREQVPLQIASVAAGALACALLIPRYGLHGAAIALAAASVVQIAGELVVLRGALGRVRAEL